MAAAASHARVNGYSSADHDGEALAGFYEQLSKLKDAVLTDSHPRLKLSATARARLRSSGRKEIAPNGSNHGSELVNGSARDAYEHNIGAFGRNQTVQKGFLQQPSTTTPLAKPTSSSGIDPVLLTKSDDLVRAEAQLKRQRIEREIKDTWDQRKHTRDRDVISEPQSLFTLSEILLQALELVKPVSGLPTAANAQDTASDSFDENSYYSSQANDWSSEQSTVSKTSPQSTRDAVTQPQGKAVPSDVPHTLPGLASNAPHSSTRACEIDRLDKQQYAALHSDGSPVHPQGSQHLAQDPNDMYDSEGEESDYSPPAADAFTDGDADGELMDLDDDGMLALFPRIAQT